MNLIQLLLHSPDPKVVARYFYCKNFREDVENFLDDFKDAQLNERQHSQNESKSEDSKFRVNFSISFTLTFHCVFLFYATYELDSTFVTLL